MRNNSSHLIYRVPSGENLVIPKKLDDKRLMRSLLKAAGVRPG